MAPQTNVPELLDAGIEVWRPVEATAEAGGALRLPDRVPDAEAWRFPLGSLVRCESKLLPGHSEELVACELVG